jgi:hypothetical protein
MTAAGSQKNGRLLARFYGWRTHLSLVRLNGFSLGAETANQRQTKIPVAMLNKSQISKILILNLNITAQCKCFGLIWRKYNCGIVRMSRGMLHSTRHVTPH